MKKFLVILALCLPALLEAQELQNFTFKQGLEYAMNTSKNFLGDSINLYLGTSTPDDKVDSYNNRGLSRNWGYIICNNDTCMNIVVNKVDNEYKLNRIIDVGSSAYYLEYDSINLDRIRYDSDSSWEMNCFEYKLGWYCSSYTLFSHTSYNGNYFGDENPVWVNILLHPKDTVFGLIHAQGDFHAFINAFTGECFGYGTNVKEDINPISDIVITPNPATDYIEIVGLSTVILNEVKDPEILVYNVLGGKLMDSRLRGNDILVPTEGNIRIDISSLSPGVYFVRIGSYFAKFVKM